MGENKDIDHYLKSDGVDSEREKMIGQTIGYRYDVNLLPDLTKLTPFLKKVFRLHGVEGPELAGRYPYGVRGRSCSCIRPQH